MPRCTTCGLRASARCPGCGADLPVRTPSPAWPGVPGFAVSGELGRGGFGAVLAARRLPEGTSVALKLAEGGAEAARQLAAEARALRAVGPPHVPALLGEGRLDDGRPYLVLERLELPTLAEVLERAGGALERADAIRAGAALLHALAALHGAGWRHGDVKPENVLVDGDRAVLVDLGLAAEAGAEADAAAALAGTAEYLSPERIEGRPEDARSDVYAAGAVLYELLAGVPPFRGAAAEVRRAHLERRPGRLAAVPAAVEAVVQRCLAKEPAARFASAAAAAAALLEARRAGGEPPEREPALEEAPPDGEAPRRQVVTVFVEGVADTVRFHAAATAVGGALAHSSGAFHAVVLDPAGGEPLRAAVRAAALLCARGVIRRARVDVVSALVQRRAAGPPRYLSAALAEPARYPAATDPDGVLVARGLADALPDEPFEPVPGLPSHLRLGVGAPGATLLHQPTAAPLLERAALLERLLALAAEAARGRPALALVLAERGLGKSRLGAALADALRGEPGGPRVVELRASGASAPGALAALLRFALRLPVAAPPEGGRDVLRRALPAGLAETWPAVALALGWLDPAAPEVRRLAAAPGALRTAQARAAGEALRRRAAVRPLAVVLDDGQDAEPAVLDALEVAALAEGGARLLVCVLARPGLLASRPALGERAARRAVLRLEPLSPGAAAELCAWLLRPAEHVPASAVARLVTRAGRVPLLLVELVRALRRDGTLRRVPGGGWFLAADELERGVEAPLVEWLAARELAALPPDLAAHAHLVALLGEDASPAEIAGVVAELDRLGAGAAFPLDADAATLRLVGLALLVPRGGRLAYAAPLLREGIAGATPPALAAAVHVAAVRHLRATGGPDPAGRERLAHHAAAAGEHGLAAEGFLARAEDHAARHDYVSAERLYSLQLAIVPEADAAARLRGRRGRGLMRMRIGRGLDAVADLEAAASEARAAGDRAAEADCLLDAAMALDWLNDYAAAAARTAAAREAAGDAAGPLLRARLELARGRSLLRAGRVDEARATLEAAAALAETHPDDGYETLVIALVLLVYVLSVVDRPDEAAGVAERAIGLATARGDRLHLGAALNNLHAVHAARGRLAEALDDLDAYLRVGRELGMPSFEYVAAHNAGELLYLAGRVEEAAPRARRAREVEERHPEVSRFRHGALLEARLLARAGHGAAAGSRLEAVAAGGAPATRALEVLVDAVSCSAASAAREAWEAVAARAAEHARGLERVEVLELWAIAAARAGRHAEAAAALGRARALAAEGGRLMLPRLGDAADLLARLAPRPQGG